MLKPIAPRTVRKQSQGGYVLLTLLLVVAVASMTVALPMVIYYRRQMQRDQEEEMIHRGVEYERAIRKYYKKFGSYPATIDLLESSNHMRFLRKRYKDPINGKDFKVLHLADVMSVLNPGIPGAQNLGQPVGGLNSGPAPAPAPPPPPTTNDGSDPNSASSAQPASGQNSGTTLPFTANPGQGQGQATGQTFGGGGVVGVASLTEKESIRVFNNKNHYNDWLFIYNPSMDRGGLPRGPYQPNLQALLPGQLGIQPGQNGIGQGGSQGFGQQGFGQQGFGQQGQQGFGQGSPMPNRR